MKFTFKRPTLNRNWLMLLGAIVLGVVATGLSKKALNDRLAEINAVAQGAHKTVTVIVAKQDLPKGTPIQKAYFAVRDMPAEYAPASSVDPGQFGQFLGQKLVAPLKGGEALLFVYVEPAVFSSTLENGNRALTTEVDEINSISGMLRPSDRIDLLVTAHGGGGNTSEVTFPLMSNVQVLATGQVTRKSDGNNQARIYSTITLSVTPEDAQRIVVAKNSGRLTAVLRNPDDDKANVLPALNIDDVLPKKPAAPKRAAAVQVQYIVGGRS